jgi:glutaredoxin
MPKEQKQKVKIFVSASCGPCERVKKLIQEGKFNLEDVDLIDLETEEGFPWIERLNLDRVPAAFEGNKVCRLDIDPEQQSLVITCPSDQTPE